MGTECFSTTDTPGPVMNLEATDIKQTSAMLAWSPPDNDGGSEVTHYIVERREIDRKTWATVKAEVAKDKVPLKVNGLMPGTEYYFRVTAVNEYGPGVPRVSPTSYLASDPVSAYQAIRPQEQKAASDYISIYTMQTFVQTYYPFSLLQVSLIPVRKLRCWRSPRIVPQWAGLSLQGTVEPKLTVMSLNTLK